MKSFLNIVKERADSTLKIDEIFCPFCKSRRITINGSRSTLVADYKDQDSNHVWKDCKCDDCSEEFVHEHKNYNTWYTQKGRVILGIPSCFENYIYHCKSCGGDVRRHELDKETGVPATVLSTDVNGNRNYVIVFRCDSCGIEAESDIEYWRKKWYAKPTKRKKGKNKKLIIGWTIREEVGLVCLNQESLEKLEFV